MGVVESKREKYVKNIDESAQRKNLFTLVSFCSLSDVYDFIALQKLLESGGNVVKNDRFPPDSSKNCFVGGGN